MQWGCGAVPALEEFCAWQGQDLAGRESFLARLEPKAEAELLGALVRLNAQAPVRVGLRRAHVPLAGLDQVIQGWNDEVVFGRGFVLVRRLRLERLSDAEAALAFAALAAHVGRAWPQDSDGTLLGEVDGARARVELSSDPCDVTALLCLRAPWRGGDLRLASMVAVHNVMARECPELLGELYQAPGSALPVFMTESGRLFARLPQGLPAGREGRFGEALARARRLAAEMALAVDFEPGDIALVNNHHLCFGLSAPPEGERRSTGRALSLRLEASRFAVRPAPYRDRALWLGAPGAMRPRVAA